MSIVEVCNVIWYNMKDKLARKNVIASIDGVHEDGVHEDFNATPA